ncbi:MAG: hypothetical protein ABGW81_03180 [Paracoccaceae bacterium]
MKKLNNHSAGVDTGLVQGFSGFADEGEMWSGTGRRIRRVEVLFSEPFLTPPAVHIGRAIRDI